MWNINYCWTSCNHFLDVTNYHGKRKALQKHTIFWLLLLICEKRTRWTPIFLHKSDQQAKMKLSAKFKKILWSGFRGILLNLLSFILACWLHFRNNQWGYRVPFWGMIIWIPKAKICGVLVGLSCYHGNFLCYKNERIFFSNNWYLV